METIKVRLETYSDLIKSKPVAVVHFWASWNQHDKEMKSRLTLIADSFTEQVVIGSADTDHPEMWALTKEAKVLNLPALAYYKNGQYIETVIGLCSKEDIEAKLKSLLAGHDLKTT